MTLIQFLLRSSWKLLAIAFFTGFLSGGSSAGLIALINRAMNRSAHTSIDSMAWAFAGVVLIALITSIISQVTLVRLSHHAVFQLRMHLLRQILASKLRHLEQLGTPRLLATLTEDVQAITNAIYGLPLLCIDLAIVLGCLAYIAWLSQTVFLFVIAFSAFALFTVYRLVAQGDRLLTQAREVEDDLFHHFRAATEGVKELKLHTERRLAFLDEDVEHTAIDYRQYNIRGQTWLAISSSWGKFIFFFAIGFVLFVLPKWMSLNFQVISGYILVFIYLVVPMDNIGNSVPHIIQANIALRKIETLGLSLGDRVEMSTTPDSCHTNWSTLTLENVIYPYQGEQEDHQFTLGPLNLTFKQGELVFIVGGNGSGKSTFVKLITGLYVPESGKIWFDQCLVDDTNRDWYRQHFSVIFADFYLFERLLGLDRPDLDSIAQSYLYKLQLDQKVNVSQGKLSTIALSQGQRKRLALLTAYLEDRPIYLFDEWAADQDPLFKEIFYTEFLFNLKSKGKTVFVVSHDDHYFHLADRVVKLNYGQVEFDQRSQCA
jgi:putative ATP-binding cassette transporter